MPAGVTAAAVEYENPSTLVEALRGKEALIITLPSTGLDQQATQLKLVEAAAESGVPYVRKPLSESVFCLRTLEDHIHYPILL